VPGAEIGACDTQVVVGQPGFLVESGLFNDTPDGRKAAAYYQEHAKETGCSIRFLYARKTADGVYFPPGLIFERSLLPRERAAFPWSGITVEGVGDMSKSIKDEARQQLVEVLGEERAKAIIDQLTAGSETLKDMGVRFKEITGEAEAPNRGNETEGEAVKEKETEAAEGTLLEAVPEEFSVVLSPEAITAVAKEVRSGLNDDMTALLEGVTQGLSDLKAVVTKMSDGVDQLTVAEDQRITEKVANLPRATVYRIQRPTQRAAEKDADSQVDKDLLARGKRALYGNETEGV